MKIKQGKNVLKIRINGKLVNSFYFLLKILFFLKIHSNVLKELLECKSNIFDTVYGIKIVFMIKINIWLRVLI